MLTKRAWRKAATVALAAAMLATSACGSNDNKGKGGEGGSGPTLAIFSGSQTPIVANFNPYSPTLLPGTLGSIYEPLFFYNKAKVGDPMPMLGESFEWSKDGKSLTVKLRKNVKWNDDKPLTAEDVIYSFTNEAVKLEYVNEVKKVEDNTIEFTFKEPQFTNEYALLGATYIVPKHVFSSQKDLVTFTNATNPVGSGPFKLKAITDASYNVVKNDKYWDPERPKIKEVQYLGIDGNSSAESLFKANQLDYSTMFVPDPKTLTGNGRLGYLRMSSPNPLSILTCSNVEYGCKGAQTDKAVRQAFSKALNRDEINKKAYYGHASLAAPTFTLPGRDEKWIKDGLPKLVPGSADVAGAKKILEDAGYKLGSDGIYAKGDQKASFTVASVEGWSDANAAGELMVAQAKAAGIQVKAETVTLDQYTEMRQNGKFEMIISALLGTPVSDPYTIYLNSFTTQATTKVGTALGPKQTNFARYANPKVDEAVKKAAQTNDEGIKKEAYAVIQQAIVEDVPYIPMFHGGSQTFFNQKDFQGWPSEEDPYAFPASWDGLQAAYVLSKVSYK